MSIHPLKKKDKDHLNFKRKIYEVLREVTHQELNNKKQKNYSIILYPQPVKNKLILSMKLRVDG